MPMRAGEGDKRQVASGKWPTGAWAGCSLSPASGRFMSAGTMVGRISERVKTFSVLAALLASVSAHAQLGHDIARRHAARAGDHLAALVAVRAEGRTFINGEVVPF